MDLCGYQFKFLLFFFKRNFKRCLSEINITLEKLIKQVLKFTMVLEDSQTGLWDGDRM